MLQANPSTVFIFIGSMAPGGAERVAAWLANTLARHECVVTVGTIDHPRNDFYLCSNNVIRIGIDEGYVCNSCWKSLLFFNRILALRRQLRRTQCDLAISFMPYESIILILASLGLGIRVIVSERNAPWLLKSGFAVRMGRFILYRFADVVVVQTRQIYNYFKRHKFSANLRIVPNSPSLSIKTAGGKCQAPLRPGLGPLIIAIGHKVQQKGLDTAVQLFNIVGVSHPDCHLAIVGLSNESPDADLLVRTVQDSDIARRILFPGVVDNIDEWYERAQVFILPSRFEGFPNALLEAMRHGLACVAYDCPTGPGDIISNGVDGMLVPLGDFDSLKNCVIQLLDDEVLRMSIGHHASSIARKYSETAIVGKWLSMLR